MDGQLVTVPYDFDDELISRTRSDLVSRVRVYGWPDVAVVIGRGGKQDLELMTDSIADDGITLYKRHGGGCSVVLDPGNLIVAAALPIAGLGGIKSAFSAVSCWLISCLSRCGVTNVQQRGVSDLVIDDRKIGGSCVYRTKGLLYYSSTLLVDHRQDLVDRYLKHPPREPYYRRGREHKKFMVSLKELGLVSHSNQWNSLLDNELQSGLPDLAKSTNCT